MSGVHSYRTDLRNSGIYTVLRDDVEIGVVSFLMPPAFVSTVLRRFCEVLDDASTAARDFDEMAS